MTWRRRGRMLAAATAVATSVLSGPVALAASGPRVISVYATYYGWYDNTPPGCATAYSGCAKGTGTYADPVTFASSVKEFPVGTILYYPTVEKYFVMGDLCQECGLDWTGKGPDGGPHLYHVDLWVGGEGGNAFDVIDCEDALTQAKPNGDPLLTPFIEDPSPSEPVSNEPLFDAATNHCFGGATAYTTFGSYQDRATSDCLEGPTGASPSTSALAVPCNSGAAEDLAFNGAFLIAPDKLCLQIEGTHVGDYLGFARCNGNPYQQWEINPNGTITWVQYTYCLAQSGDRVKLTTCTSRAVELWRFRAESAAMKSN